MPADRQRVETMHCPSERLQTIHSEIKHNLGNEKAKARSWLFRALFAAIGSVVCVFSAFCEDDVALFERDVVV